MRSLAGACGQLHNTNPAGEVTRAASINHPRNLLHGGHVPGCATRAGVSLPCSSALPVPGRQLDPFILGILRAFPLVDSLRALFGKTREKRKHGRRVEGRCLKVVLAACLVPTPFSFATLGPRGRARGRLYALVELVPPRRRDKRLHVSSLLKELNERPGVWIHSLHPAVPGALRGRERRETTT